MSIRSDLKHVSVVIDYCRAEPADAELAAFVIALEDKRFLDHPGVDAVALCRAALRALQGKANGGASTIDMQLVRTITNRRERSIGRKLREIAVAVLIRRKYGHAVVLNTYLRIAYAGYRLTGLSEAAKTLFGRPIHECSRHEKSMLAGVLLVPVSRHRTEQWHARLNVRAARARYRVDKLALGILRGSQVSSKSGQPVPIGAAR